MNLKAMRAAALKAAHDIVEQAKLAARDLTADEQAEVEAKIAEVAELDGKIAEAAKSADLMSKIGSFGPGEDVEDEPEGEERAKSLGEHYAKHVGPEGFRRLKEQGGFTATAPEFKANTDTNFTPGVFDAPVLTDVDRTIVRGFRRATVSDLLGVGSISGNAVSYFVEGAMEGDFTTVAAGGQKPQIHAADPTPVTDTLKKIAAWWDTADEMIDDVPFWVSEVNNRGLHLLSMVEEAQLLNGNGQGSNIKGLLQRSGIQTEDEGAPDGGAADAIFRALMKVQTATGFSADGIIINPADYQTLRLAKDGNEQYMGGGFFAGQYGAGGITMQPPLWGVNTVVSAAVPAKTVVVGAFKPASTVYRKGGVRVESTNSDASKFTKDIVTTRIEERLALAVRVPLAVVKVTLLAE